jgi:hypothetical protein
MASSMETDLYIVTSSAMNGPAQDDAMPQSKCQRCRGNYDYEELLHILRALLQIDIKALRVCTAVHGRRQSDRLSGS